MKYIYKKFKSWLKYLMLLCCALMFSFISNAQILIDGNPAEWGTSAVTGLSTFTHVNDAFGNGVVDNQFAQAKDFFLAADMNWTIGQTKAKGDIANGAAVIKDNVLYFAGDRTSNNGDAQIGFWFYLGGTGPVGTTSGSFAPPHVVGDLLILADFTSGGRLGTVNVYKWVGSGGNVSNTNGTLNTTNLTGTVAENNDAVYNIPSGWSFTKPTYDINEFYEGQVDLTSLGLSSFCASTFLLETRSSQSVTAELDDFVGGTFGAVPLAQVLTPSCGLTTDGLGIITMASSEIGVTYQLLFGTSVKKTSGGTGSAIVWTGLTDPGSYTVHATNDATLCPKDFGPVTVALCPPPSCDLQGPTLLCVDNSTVGYSTVYNANYGYQWTLTNNGTNASINTGQGTATITVVTGTQPGTYDISVKVTEINNETNSSTCQTSATLVAPPVLTITPTNVTCYGAANGGIDLGFTASEYSAISYFWSASNGGTIPAGQANLQDLSGIVPGTYHVIVTKTSIFGGLQCSTSTETTITEPTAVTLDLGMTPPLCKLGTDGKVTATFGGGTGAYQAKIDLGEFAAATSPKEFLGLSAGTHTVTVKDANGCQKTASIVITEPTAVSLDLEKTDVLCKGDANGKVQATFSGGTAPYQIKIDALGFTTQSSVYEFTGLLAGTHTVTVMDKNGCSKTLTIEVKQPAKLDAYDAQENVKCFGGNDGNFKVYIEGGTLPYKISLNGGEYETLTETFKKFTDLVAGDYDWSVMDKNGCTKTGTVTITQPDELICSTEMLSEADCGKNIGSAIVYVEGGTPEYIYEWIGGTQTQTTQTATNLAPGWYTIKVTDKNGCQTTCEVEITEIPCKVEFCTYTQGKYGNQNGKACDLTGKTQDALFVASLLAKGDLVIGTGSNTITFGSDDAPVIKSILPGGSGVGVITGIWSPALNTIVKGSAFFNAFLTKQGKLNNGLLAQTITLGLNLRINDGFPDLALESGKYLTTQKKLSCEEGSGVVDPVCTPVYALDGITITGYNMTVNPYWYGMLPANVVDYLAGGSRATVQGLFDFANEALGGATLPAGITLVNIMSAVDLINNAFDECRAFVGYRDTKFACQLDGSLKVAQILPSALKVYPNPFSDQVTFEFVSDKDSKAVLEITNIVGQKIITLLEGQVKAGALNRIEYQPKNVVPGVLIYRLILDGNIQNGRVVYKK